MIASNVISTIDAVKLCNEGKPRLFTFVSSTSALDTDYYVKLSEKQVSTGKTLSLRTMTCSVVELVLVLAVAKRNGCLSISSVQLEPEVFRALCFDLGTF